MLKFSPDGKLLLTLGKPGGAAAPDYFYQPNDVAHRAERRHLRRPKDTAPATTAS